MLVYIRTDLIDKILLPVTEKDMPDNIKESLMQKKEMKNYLFFKVPFFFFIY
jgi:hypothetical protein